MGDSGCCFELEHLFSEQVKMMEMDVKKERHAQVSYIAAFERKRVLLCRYLYSRVLSSHFLFVHSV